MVALTFPNGKEKINQQLQHPLLSPYRGIYLKYQPHHDQPRLKRSKRLQMALPFMRFHSSWLLLFSLSLFRRFMYIWQPPFKLVYFCLQERNVASVGSLDIYLSKCRQRAKTRYWRSKGTEQFLSWMRMESSTCCLSVEYARNQIASMDSS